MAIVPSSTSILFTSIFISLFFTSCSQTCSNHKFTSERFFTSCKDLPYLNAHLHWIYFKSTNQSKIAFRAPHTPKGWIAWAINPYRRSMVGSQALIAFRNTKGMMSAYTTTISGYNPSMQPKKLTFHVSKLSTEYSKNEITIFAVVGPLAHGPVVNQVWQVGSLDKNGVPMMHEMGLQNLQSTNVIDFSSL
ncbi:hypothetical protein L2E82_25495 [Cichorium intybus]|uniref:Uncharacterized protein n=1 Tax=Cichorium intybus TaxID=13427 RepID=A0ACB9E370_CICIN|nr:hypothetical protein L2E82_25495 [Cichorium intybus]